MINSDNMDKVISELETLSQSLISRTRQNESILSCIASIEEAILELKKMEASNTDFVEHIDNLETKYSNISTNIEIALQDYKKIHSMFELQELEIKKLHSALDETIKTINENNASMQKSFDETIKTINKNHASIKNHYDKKNGLLCKGVIAGFAVTIVLAIINIFMCASI
ncbi:MAG: hypothetical protein R3Y23_01160 [Bacillota bacterium]